MAPALGTSISARAGASPPETELLGGPGFSGQEPPAPPLHTIPPSMASSCLCFLQTARPLVGHTPAPQQGLLAALCVCTYIYNIYSLYIYIHDRRPGVFAARCCLKPQLAWQGPAGSVSPTAGEANPAALFPRAPQGWARHPCFVEQPTRQGDPQGVSYSSSGQHEVLSSEQSEAAGPCHEVYPQQHLGSLPSPPLVAPMPPFQLVLLEAALGAGVGAPVCVSGSCVCARQSAVNIYLSLCCRSWGGAVGWGHVSCLSDAALSLPELSRIVQTALPLSGVSGQVHGCRALGGNPPPFTLGVLEGLMLQGQH